MNFGADLSLQVLLAQRAYQQHLNRLLKDTAVNQQYFILLLLKSLGGKASQKKLCAELRIEKSNMVAAISQLMANGYVTREVDYKDRRGKIITLTTKAIALVAEIENHFADLEREIAVDLTWQEMYNCLLVLNKVNDKFSQIDKIRITPQGADAIEA